MLLHLFTKVFGNIRVHLILCQLGVIGIVIKQKEPDLDTIAALFAYILVLLKLNAIRVRAKGVNADLGLFFSKKIEAKNYYRRQ